MTSKMLMWYGWMALGSLCLKIPLALYTYEYGYLSGNRLIASPDSFDYVTHAENHMVDVHFFGHWLYDFLNECVYNLAPNHIPVFLVMLLLNIVFSLMLPIALWPAVQGLDLASSQRESYFIGLCGLLLFWPTALWLSTQNLKDMLTALLVSAFISVFVYGTQTVRRGFLSLCGLSVLGVGLLYGIFSLRSYLAVFLLLAAVIHLLFQEKQIGIKVVIGLVLVGLLISPVGQGILQFASPDRNWLINPAVAAEINEDQESQGHDLLVVNRTPGSLLLTLPKTIINPFPSIQLETVNDLLEVLRSIVLCFTVFFFTVSFWKWKAPIKWFLVLCLLLPMSFYLVVPGYSGPRQFFSSGIDIIFLFLLPSFLLRDWQSSTFFISLLLGLLGSNGGLFFTSKALF